MFSRRIYHSPRQLWADGAAIFRSRARVRYIMKGGVAPAFRERLMMAVTAVNACRYCSYFHAREALAVGIAPEEASRLLSGVIDNTHLEEATALLYAQHWAETDAQPDPGARQRLIDAYGEQTTADIELILRMIRWGNLMGNTWDYILYRGSGGRLGLSAADRRAVA
jgi:AhpD family alkylhydroperoxidase